ncbi:unnamed protein product, partial [Ectocarpus sp. 12 AP-2014]
GRVELEKLLDQILGVTPRVELNYALCPCVFTLLPDECGRHRVKGRSCSSICSAVLSPSLCSFVFFSAQLRCSEALCSLTGRLCFLPLSFFHLLGCICLVQLVCVFTGCLVPRARSCASSEAESTVEEK